MNTVPYIRRWAEQWWDWKEVQEYAKDKDMEWSEQQCKDFLEEHEEEISTSNEETFSNGLENFEIKEDVLELFNSESEQEEEITSLDKTENKEENDLEIPAFLRRQKN